MANEGGGDAATFDDERAEVKGETVECRMEKAAHTSGVSRRCLGDPCVLSSAAECETR